MIPYWHKGLEGEQIQIIRLKEQFLEEDTNERIRTSVLDMLTEFDEEGIAAVHKLISNSFY